MKMQTRPVLYGRREVVFQMDNHSITPIDLERWPWHCAVDSERPSWAAVWGYDGLIDYEPEFTSHACVWDSGGVVRGYVVVAPLLSIVRCVAFSGVYRSFWHI